MHTQKQWIPKYKETLGIKTDYELAKHWRTSSAIVCQLVYERRKLSVANKIMITQALEIDPIQVFISCEFYKAGEDEKEFLTHEYFKSVIKTYNVVVPVQFYKRRKYK